MPAFNIHQTAIKAIESLMATNGKEYQAYEEALAQTHTPETEARRKRVREKMRDIERQQEELNYSRQVLLSEQEAEGDSIEVAIKSAMISEGYVPRVAVTTSKSDTLSIGGIIYINQQLTIRTKLLDDDYVKVTLHGPNSGIENPDATLPLMHPTDTDHLAQSIIDICAFIEAANLKDA